MAKLVQSNPSTGMALTKARGENWPGEKSGMLRKSFRISWSPAGSGHLLILCRNVEGTILNLIYPYPGVTWKMDCYWLSTTTCWVFLSQQGTPGVEKNLRWGWQKEGDGDSCFLPRWNAVELTSPFVKKRGCWRNGSSCRAHALQV
jgi:hypothetical protein